MNILNSSVTLVTIVTHNSPLDKEDMRLSSYHTNSHDSWAGPLEMTKREKLLRPLSTYAVHVLLVSRYYMYIVYVHV